MPGGIICPFASGVEVLDFETGNFLDVLEWKKEEGGSVVVFDLRKSFGNDLEGVCDFLDTKNDCGSLREILLFGNEGISERAYVSIFGDYTNLENSKWIPCPDYHPRHYGIPMVVFLFADSNFSEKAQIPIGLNEANRVCQMLYGEDIVGRVKFEWNNGMIDVVENVSWVEDGEIELMVSLYKANKAGLINVSFEDFCNVANRKSYNM